jgi:hypothetical protein
VAFAAPYPGKIVPLNLAEMGGRFICQKDAFLCAAKGTEVDIALHTRLGSGLFGDGMAFVHAGGTVIRKDLNGGTLLVDTGCLVGFAEGIDYSIQQAGNLKSMLFGGALDSYALVRSGDEIKTLSEGYNSMLQGLQERERIKGLFGQYLTREVSGRMRPKEVVTFLNRYFNEMIEVIVRHRGIIDKFIGDGILAVFKVPVPAKADRTARGRAAGCSRRTVWPLLRNLFCTLRPLSRGSGRGGGAGGSAREYEYSQTAQSDYTDPNTHRRSLHPLGLILAGSNSLTIPPRTR